MRDAIKLNGVVTQIASSLNSPHLPNRKVICEVLLSIIYNGTDPLSLVFPALEALSGANGETHGYYDYWFRSLESALLGRGKMGSLVGASEEVRKGAGHDNSLADYAVSMLYLRSS